VRTRKSRPQVAEQNVPGKCTGPAFGALRTQSEERALLGRWSGVDRRSWSPCRSEDYSQCGRSHWAVSAGVAHDLIKVVFFKSLAPV
jgi:hypothetical protein